jgi:hypothetical protein
VSRSPNRVHRVEHTQGSEMGDLGFLAIGGESEPQAMEEWMQENAESLEGFGPPEHNTHTLCPMCLYCSCE